MSWTKGLPTEPGDYWFYGYRYGKVSCGNEASPKFMRMRVTMTVNNYLMYVTEGQFLYESEVEEPWHMPLEYPIPPNMEEANANLIAAAPDLLDNANLIAAAPDLLDVLERLVTYYAGETRAEAVFKLKAAHAAINKAKGITDE